MLVPVDRAVRERMAAGAIKKIGGVIPEKYETLVFSHPTGKAGVALFYNYDGHNVDINIASDSPLVCSRGNIRIGLRYAFDQLKVERITAVIRKNNRVCRRLVEMIGFRLEGVIRKGERKGDLMIYGLLRDEYLKGKFVWAS